MKKLRQFYKENQFVESLITGGELRYNLETGKYIADFYNQKKWQTFDTKQEALSAAIRDRGQTR